MRVHESRHNFNISTLPLTVACHFPCAVVRGRDPSAVAVLAEDGAAVTGVMLAAACLGLTTYTGSPLFDAIGSIMIGSKSLLQCCE